MADLSAIPAENIEALETALASIGLSVGDIDGVASPELQVAVITGLNTFNQLFGDDSTVPVTGYDAGQVADIAKRIEEFVQGDGNGPSQFDQVKALVNRDYAALGLDGPLNALTRGVIDHAFEGKTPAEAMPGLLDMIKRTGNYPDLVPLIDSLPPNIVANVPAAVEFLEHAQEHIDVINQLAEGMFFEEELAADVIAAADPVVQQQSVLTDVEAAIGIETPDGVWGASEQAALKARIAEMQAGDPLWLGRDDGVYTAEYADYVLGGLDYLPADARKVYPETDQALFRNLQTLKEQNVALLSEADTPTDTAVVVAGVIAIDELLPVLVPVVQEQMDAEIAKAQMLIDSIQGGGLSELQIKDAMAVMTRTDYIDDMTQERLDGLTDEEFSKYEADLSDRTEARDYLGRTGLGDNIGNFVDGFLLLGESEFGRRMVQRGKDWSVGMIEARIANLNDLPDVDALNPGDGQLDRTEQKALQGVIYLMGEKLGIPADQRWPLTEAVEDRYVVAFNGTPFAEREALFLGVANEEQLAAYNALEQEAKEAMVEGAVADIFATVTMLVEEGVLDKTQYYAYEGYEIGDVTIEIFDEFMHGVDAPENPVAPATPEQLIMLNALTRAFTDDMDLTGIMGDDYVFPDGFEAIDPLEGETLAERMADAYSGAQDAEYMLMMIDTLPFGTTERRDEIKNVTRSAIEVADKAKAEGASDELVAILFANAMEGGINAMNANESMGSDYLYIDQRPITMDPRSADFSLVVEGHGEPVTADEIKGMYDALNHDVDAVTEPIMFEEGGVTYVAVADHVSGVFSIEEVDFEAWERIVAENPIRPGEDPIEYGMSLDEKLSAVSGYDLLFQNMYEENQATVIKGIGAINFPGVMAEKIQSFSEVRSSIDGDIAARAAADHAAAIEAGTPRGPREEFEAMARGEAAAGSPGTFRDNADEISVPPAQRGGQPDLLVRTPFSVSQ